MPTAAPRSLRLCRSIPRAVTDFGKMWKGETAKRLRALRVLVIDEISMVSGAWPVALVFTARGSMVGALGRLADLIRGAWAGRQAGESARRLLWEPGALPRAPPLNARAPHVHPRSPFPAAHH